MSQSANISTFNIRNWHLYGKKFVTDVALKAFLYGQILIVLSNDCLYWVGSSNLLINRSRDLKNDMVKP